jgi:hypothetical protein
VDLVAADIKVPDRHRHASEVLSREDVSDCSLLPDLQCAQGDIFDPFEILLVVRKKMRDSMIDHGCYNIQVMNFLARNGVFFNQIH